MEIGNITQGSIGLRGAAQVGNAGNQVGVDGNNEMDIEQSSAGRVQNGCADQKFEYKGLKQHDVLENNHFSTEKRTHDGALGNESDSGEPDNKRRRRNAHNDSYRGGVGKPLNQQGVIEKQNNVGPSQPAAETPIYTHEYAMSKLDECFKKSNSDFKEFNFKRFAEVNEISLNDNYIPHSNIVKNSFQCMYDVARELLSDGITFKKADGKNIPIKLTPKEVLGIINTLGNVPDEDKAYKLYGELGVIIFREINSAVQNTNKETLGESLWINYYTCKSILSLPLVNCAEGINVCKKMIDSMLTDTYSVFELSEPKLSDVEREKKDHKDLVNDFKKLAMFFAFKNKELAKGILPAAQFATSIGMKMPLFMAEVTTKGNGLGIKGFSNNVVGVAVCDTDDVSEKDSKGFPHAHFTFYHEITHHARSAVGAIHADKLIARVSLMNVFWSNASLVNAINFQISNYALTNYEEYVAEFSGLVLCCLEDNKNPFDYIKDARLWRLYYEFGGPDFAPIIQQKGFLPDIYAKDCDILSDKKCDWCSGYPSKFGIDVDKLSKKNISVDIYLHGDSYLVPITSKIVFPPPPLGYCYTTEGGCIGLKIDKNVLPDSDDCYCSPSYCSLTNGPLTSLLYSQFQLGHHFELLPNENVDMSKHIDSAKPSSTNEASNSMITTIGSAIGTIVRLPVTAVQWGFSWFSSSK